MSDFTHDKIKMPDLQASTHVFKVVDGLSLSIDVSKPSDALKNGIVLLHFHGGFLVDFKIPRSPGSQLMRNAGAR
jgi:hypothetical protein